MTEQSEPLFLANLDVVSTKRPSTGEPLVGLVMAQRIHPLQSRAEVEAFVEKVMAACRAAWPGVEARAAAAVRLAATEPGRAVKLEGLGGLCASGRDNHGTCFADGSVVCTRPAAPPHPCPFKQEIHEDNETLCNCCKECQHECAQDI